MRLTLGDLKKSIMRRKGQPQPRLVPYLLPPGERHAELDALIALYERSLDLERARFPADQPSAVVGDYRLARCLCACLEEWYAWQTPAWPGPGSPDLAEALARRGITSASDLRLALYDAVNARGGGYLGAAERPAALDEFAGELGIPSLLLEPLLTLDRDPDAVLTRVSPEPPTAGELATRYNQRALEAVLTASSIIEWRISPADPGESAEPLGTTVKRVCFLARQYGVHYELEYDDASAREAERTLVITLYGPQEVMGAPNQYGDRLTRLCRALLGYRRGSTSVGPAALARGDLQGTARVYLHGRPLVFEMDDRLLKLVQAPMLAHTSRSQADNESDAAYDSSVEARLARTFRALERDDATHGWHLEHEPEPLLTGDVIMVPDFALMRDHRRVYLEVAGYWRPGYRERKARKLLALRGTADLMVAAPTTARDELATLEGEMPVVWYDDAISAPHLLAVLDEAFGDFSARLDALDRSAVRAAVHARGRISERGAMALLHCYTRSELRTALTRVVNLAAGSSNGLHWIDGVGLCTEDWLRAALNALVAYVAASADESVPLDALVRHVARSVPACADATDLLASTLARMAGLEVAQSSLFASQVRLRARANQVPVPAAATAAAQGAAKAAATPARAARKAQPQAHSRRSTARASSASYAAPSLFPAERAAGDDCSPHPPTPAIDHQH